MHVYLFIWYQHADIFIWIASRFSLFLWFPTIWHHVSNGILKAHQMCGLMSFNDFRKCLLIIFSITTSVPYYSRFWSPVAYMIDFFIMFCMSLVEMYVFSVFFYLYRLLYGYFPLICSIFQFINYISCMPS